MLLENNLCKDSSFELFLCVFESVRSFADLHNLDFYNVCVLYYIYIGRRPAQISLFKIERVNKSLSRLCACKFLHSYRLDSFAVTGTGKAFLLSCFSALSSDLQEFVKSCPI
jgi:hypothetical protein